MSHRFPIFNPAAFQGRNKKRFYFEGWYFKILNESETSAFAIIPGVAMDEAGNRHAFIQVLDGKNRVSAYHTFDIHAFTAASGIFDIAIADNTFSEKGFHLALPGLHGTLHFSDTVPWPSHWWSPGIMGPFTFVPFMECYHGVVSMDHTVSGCLTVDDEAVDFENGRGYCEKDWGRSFPGAYVWMQSNHFDVPGISVNASVARIPWLGGSFTGFIAGVWIRDHLLQFTTYNGTLLRRLLIAIGCIVLVMENRRYLLKIVVKRDAATALASPIRGFMDGRIEESMTSRMEVTVTDRKSGNVLLQNTGRSAAVEVAGNINEIIRK